MEEGSPLARIKVSSAHSKTGHGSCGSIGWQSSPLELASLIRGWRTSATIMNRKGEMGSPWRRPRRYVIQRLSTPFSTTVVLLAERTRLTQRNHFSSKPLAWRMARRLPHSTESNAFLKSINF
jgi:hypothetical protein